MKNLHQLSKPAHYRPFLNGQYRVNVGLHKLGTDFGNGPMDLHRIQLDQNYRQYQSQKFTSRRENQGKYVQTDTLDNEKRNLVVETFINTLLKEYPSEFSLRPIHGGMHEFCNHISGEYITLAPDNTLAQQDTAANPPYADALDALACQIQEDIAVVSLDASGADAISALHLCFPNYWSAEEKLGKPFLEAHQPVPGFEPIEKIHRQVLRSLIQKGPFVRFAWGLSTDARLNHHPSPAEGVDGKTWHGRSFDPVAPELYVRVERQVTVPLPGIHSFIFLIRTYFEDASQLKRHDKIALANAIRDMREDTLVYKGLFKQRDVILEWLEAGV